MKIMMGMTKPASRDVTNTAGLSLSVASVFELQVVAFLVGVAENIPLQVVVVCCSVAVVVRGWGLCGDIAEPWCLIHCQRGATVSHSLVILS